MTKTWLTFMKDTGSASQPGTILSPFHAYELPDRCQGGRIVIVVCDNLKLQTKQGIANVTGDCMGATGNVSHWIFSVNESLKSVVPLGETTGLSINLPNMPLTNANVECPELELTAVGIGSDKKDQLPSEHRYNGKWNPKSKLYEFPNF